MRISGWSIRQLAERRAVRARGGSPAATPARIPAAAPSTQSSRVWLTISMIVRTPRPSSPTSRAQAPSNSTSLEAFERLPSLSLRRWRWMRLRSPSGENARQQEARQPAGRLGEHEERVAHRRRQNHLWPVSSYSAPGPPPFSGLARGRVGAHVGAALLLGHRHAARARRALSGAGGGAASYALRGQPRLPLRGELGLRAQRRHRRVGHRDRAADAGLDLAEAHEHRRPRDVGAGLRVAPRQGVEAEPDRDAPSARARPDGTRPRRCGGRTGRACGASAGSRWPRGPSAGRAPLPANAPTSPMASAAQSAPSRRRASASARSAVKTL